MNRRTLLTTITTAALVTGLMSGAVGTALAVHDAGLFELDVQAGPPAQGNANTADGAAAGEDWATIYASLSGGSTNAFGVSFIADTVGSAETSFYTGGGSKDINDVSGKGSWQYGTSNDPIPDKDDIVHAFAAAYVDPADDHTLVYFGMDRYDNNGDAEAGFWFFKGDVTQAAEPNFNGLHQVGDVLVLINWGGSNPVGEMTVYEWVGGKNPLALVADNLTADCATAGANDNFCGVANRTTDNQPWPFLDKGASTSIRPLELLEAGIDLNALFGDDICFSSFLASTRSSHSTTAQLKDFALGGFESCSAALTTTPSPGAGGSVTPGTSVTDTATITGSGGPNPPTPTGSVTFFLCGPIATGTCDSPAGTQVGAPKALSGANGVATATSDAVDTTGFAAGRYCFRATWPGDSNYEALSHGGTGNSECFLVTDTTSATSAQDWLPNDSGTITSAGGTALNGTLSFTLFSGGTCTGTVLRAAETFTLTNEPSPATRVTTNTTTKVTSSATVSWLVQFSSSDSNVGGSSHCESTQLTITN